MPKPSPLECPGSYTLVSVVGANAACPVCELVFTDLRVENRHGKGHLPGHGRLTFPPERPARIVRLSPEQRARMRERHAPQLPPAPPPLPEPEPELEPVEVEAELLDDDAIVPATAAGITPEQRAEQVRLTLAAEEREEKSLSDETRIAYGKQWRYFAAWCAETGCAPLPCSYATLRLYIEALAQRGKAWRSIKLAVSAIGAQHRDADMPVPHAHPRVAKLLAGVRRTIGTRPKNRRAPLRKAGLERVTTGMGSRLIAIRDRAILLLGWALCSRRSNIASLNVEDLAFYPDHLVVLFKRSKTDQEGEGREIVVKPATAPELCPIAAVRQWIEEAHLVTGPLFRSITKSGKVKPRPLSRVDIGRIVKRRAAKAGLDPSRLSSHSLRAGAATEAGVANGLPAVMKLGGWKSADVAASYIRIEDMRQNHPLDGVLGEASRPTPRR